MEPQDTAAPLPLRREGDLRRITDLEQRVRLLDEAIARVQQTEGRLHASEAAFRRITEDCGGLLQAVGTVEQLEVLNERLTRALEESTRRIGQFEEGMGREWESLRESYEKSLQGLQEQALAIRQTSLEAAQSVALCRKFAEDSFAALAARGQTLASLPAAPSLQSEPWSFEDVTRVHRDVRSAQQRQAGHASTDEQTTVDSGHTGPTINVGSNDHERVPRGRVFRWSALALLLLAGAGIVSYNLQMRERVVFLDSRVREATARIADSERKAAEIRQLAQQQVLEAQRTARYAQAVAEIVAAPDLRRIDLVGREPAPEAFAQALFSRTRGFHLSASRLPQAPHGKVYQVWAVARGETASLGVFEPNLDGRGDLLVDSALTLPRVTALIISLEDSAGTEHPTGMIYLGPRPRLEE